MSREAYNYKRSAIRTARELQYPETVIDRLKMAESVSEIARIMRTEREKEA